MRIYDSILLAIIAIAAFVHLNRMRERGWCETAGFALIAAGAAGRLLEHWWTGMMSVMYANQFIVTGMAILAVKLAASDLQRMLNYDKALQNFPRTILEAATVAETREDIQTLKIAAHAVLAREGYERAAVFDPPPSDAFLDQRFNRQA